jgi:hypothetical protein
MFLETSLTGVFAVHRGYRVPSPACLLIPGHEVGWDGKLPMEQIGALLARHHAISRRVEVTGQRLSAIPLAGVPEILLSGQLRSACPDARRAADTRRLASSWPATWKPSPLPARRAVAVEDHAQRQQRVSEPATGRQRVRRAGAQGAGLDVSRDL